MPLKGAQDDINRKPRTNNRLAYRQDGDGGGAVGPRFREKGFPEQQKAFRREQHSCSYRVGNGLACLLGLCLADWLFEMFM
jgi:hypothetical protein